MGLLSAVGSVARIVGPLYVTTVFEHYGLRLCFGIIASITFAAFFFSLFSWTRLVPFGERKNKRVSLSSEFYVDESTRDSDNESYEDMPDCA